MPEKPGWLHELFIHPYVGGVTHAQCLSQLVQAGAPAQQPDGEGVAEVHRRDVRHSDLIAALPDGVLERLGGGDGTRGAGDDQLRRLVVAHLEATEDGRYRLVGDAPDTRGEVGAGTAEMDLGRFEVDVALQEPPNLAHRYPRVEHQPYHGGVADVVAGVLREGEKLIDLLLLQEDDLLVQRLVHGLYGIEVQASVLGGPYPVEEPPHGRVLAIDGKTLAVAFQQVVAELHNGADADVIDLGNVPFPKEAGEPAQVGHVELGRAGARTRVLRKVGLEIRDQVFYLHARHSTAICGGIAPRKSRCRLPSSYKEQRANR